MTLDEALAICPVMAILRGVAPGEAVEIAHSVYDAGIRTLEVPLNSPQPFESIAALTRSFGDRVALAGGTVLTPEAATKVAEAGGRIAVSPDTAPEVIARSRALGIEPLPGFSTPTEAFAAVRAGARHLKLFPAVTVGPGHLRQLMAVLPHDVVIWAVGGVGPETMAAWRAAGARGFGLGSDLYKPGQGADETAKKAARAVAAAAALETAAAPSTASRSPSPTPTGG